MLTILLEENNPPAPNETSPPPFEQPDPSYPNQPAEPELPSTGTGQVQPDSADDEVNGDNSHASNETTGENRTPIALTMQIGSYTMEVNGEARQLDTAPLLVSPGHTLVPVRFITEALGGEVGWVPEQQKVELWLDGQYFSLLIGQLVPGTTVAAMIQDQRTFVPLRYVMESFGAEVQWFGRQEVIFIKYPA